MTLSEVESIKSKAVDNASVYSLKAAVETNAEEKSIYEQIAETSREIVKQANIILRV